MSSPSDLVTLTFAQSWLGTTDETTLPSLITQISRAILTDLQRPFILPYAYTESRDGGGEKEILLRNWPAIAVSSVSVNGQAVQASPALISGQSWQPGFVLEPADQMPPGRMQSLSLRGHYSFCHGASNIAINYVAGYQITNEAAAVQLSAPYQVTSQQPFGLWGSDRGVSYANGTAMVAVTGTPATGQYSVNASTGVYSFAASDAGASVLLTYGYVPADLANAAIEWIADRWAYKNRVGTRSKSLGGQETVSFAITSVPSFVDKALQPYRRVITP